MGKLRLKRFVLLISIAPFLSGCGYKFIAGGERNIFIQPILNHSSQPLADIYLTNAIRKIFIEHPDFSVVNSETSADYVLHLNIKKWDRSPLFFSNENSKDIVIARFYTETEISAFKNGENLFTDVIKETLAASLATEYDENGVLERISEKLAWKIYLKFLEKNEKQGF